MSLFQAFLSDEDFQLCERWKTDQSDLLGKIARGCLRSGVMTPRQRRVLQEGDNGGFRLNGRQRGGASGFRELDFTEDFDREADEDWRDCFEPDPNG
jgi:hypothetical protein